MRIQALRRWLAALAFAVPVAGAAAPSALYVLGDSLSDQGNLLIATTLAGGAANALPDPLHYFSGRFSDGPVFTDYLAADLGVTLAPSLAGGTNFAFGGARTDYNTVEQRAGGGFPNDLFPWSLRGEIAAFEARDVNDPDALFLVFSGSNDVADILVRGLDPTVIIPNAVDAILEAVDAFIDAAARTIIVPNLPDLGLTPLFLSRGPAAAGAATALSMQFNALLKARLDAVSGVDIVGIDTFDLIRSLVADPARYGLANVTTPCYTGFVVPNPNATECADPGGYLFWDVVHPTTGVHRIVADAVIEAVPEPGTLVLLPVALLAALAMRHRVTARRAAGDVQLA